MNLTYTLRNNFQFLVILISWVIVGAFMGPVHFGFISLMVFLFMFKELTGNILIGFLFILILSDNLEPATAFAKTYKNIYILLLFFYFLSDRGSRKVFIDYYKLFIPYFVLGIIGLYYSPVQSTSIQKLLSYVLLFIAVPNIVIKAYLEDGQNFISDLLYFLFAIIVIGFAMSFIWPEVAVSHGGRLRGIFGNPNGLGIYCILVYMLFFVVNSRFPDLFSRPEKIIFILLMFLVVIRSGSRTALMAMLLFHLFHYVFKRSQFLGFILFLVTAMSVELFIIYLPQIIVALDLQDSFRLDTLQEGSGRTVAWGFAWQNIQESLLIGKGFAYDEHLMRSNFDFLSQEGHQGGVHNTYLIMWLNTGLIGLLAFLRGFFLLFYKAAKFSAYAYPVMIAIMLSINFEPWLAASLNPFTILFLIIITFLTLDFWVNPVEVEEEKSSNENETQLA